MTIEIKGHKLEIELGTYYKGCPQTLETPEELPYYDINNVVMVSNPGLDYDQIENLLEVDDLWNEINYLLLDKK
jgi:hypothetical protein